jgi:microcystin-dependent protein
MATGYTAPLGKFIAFDDLGAPLSGGKVYTFLAGTSTPVPTFTTNIVDPPNAIPNSNPVILDSAGRASIFIRDDVSYKFLVHTALGTPLWTQDNISIPGASSGSGGGGTETPASTVPPGVILPYGGASAPDGFLLCDGAAHPIANHQAAEGEPAKLFDIIGTTFGGGGSTFNVPDMRGRFPMGVRTSGDGSSRGSTGGEFNHRHDGDQHLHVMPAHSHTMAHEHAMPGDGWVPNAQNLGGPASDIAGRIIVGGGTLTNLYQPTIASIKTTTLDTANTGATAPTNTQTITPPLPKTGEANPPYIALNFIIKT